jgi:hypothetical protein
VTCDTAGKPRAVVVVVLDGMSDIEHELITDIDVARTEIAKLRALAERALVAASTAQDAAYGRHEEWIDDALRELLAPGR